MLDESAFGRVNTTRSRGELGAARFERRCGGPLPRRNPLRGHRRRRAGDHDERGVHPSDELIIGVRGDERLEYRFSGASQTFAEYTPEGLTSVKLVEELEAWNRRIGNVWDDPAAVSTDGSKLWIVPGMCTIALFLT